MLDELQAIHEDLVKGLKTSMHKCGEMMRTKVVHISLTPFAEYLETFLLKTFFFVFRHMHGIMVR